MERKKQRAEARGPAEIVTSREALKLQLELESNPEYFIPGEKSTHKPPKTRQHGVEAVPVAQHKAQRGRGRGRGQFRGRGRGRGRFSKLPSVADLARRILEAEQVMAHTSSASELNISTATTRSQLNIRSSQSEPQIEDDTQSQEESSEPQIEDDTQSQEESSEAQIEDVSQSEVQSHSQPHAKVLSVLLHA